MDEVQRYKYGMKAHRNFSDGTPRYTSEIAVTVYALDHREAEKITLEILPPNPGGYTLVTLTIAPEW